MPRPIALSLILKVLKQHGFELVSQKGSHAKFRKKGKNKRTVIVKMGKKQVPHGTFRSIMFQAGLKEEDFRKL